MERARQAAAKPECEDDPRPVLDPEHGTCDPLCRAAAHVPHVLARAALEFDALGVCELCFVGASDEEIDACSVTLDDGGREADLLQQMGACEHTSVALALA